MRDAVYFRAQDEETTCVHCHHKMHEGCGIKAKEDPLTLTVETKTGSRKLCEVCAITYSTFEKFAIEDSHLDVMGFFHQMLGIATT